MGSVRGLSVRVGAVLLGLAYAWWAVSLAPFSAEATAAVVSAGVVAAGVGWRRRRRAVQLAPRPTVAPWAALAVAAATWQLIAYLQHPRAEHPTISSLTNALLDSQPLRACAFLLWVIAAAEIARR